MKSAVGVDDLAGAVVELALGDGYDGLGDVLGGAPAARGEEAIDDEFVVFFFHGGGHVGGDDARADLEHADAVFGQPVGEQGGHHAQAGFADAVFAADRRTGEGGNRADIDDAAAAVRMFGLLADHPAGDLLGEKVGALEVDLHHPLETLFGGFQEIDAVQGGDAGVVDQEIAAAKAVFHGLDHPPAVGRDADVGLDPEKRRSARFDFFLHSFFVHGLVGGGLGPCACVVDGQIEARPREFERDSLADATPAAGNEGNWFGVHGLLEVRRRLGNGRMEDSVLS